MAAYGLFLCHKKNSVLNVCALNRECVKERQKSKKPGYSLQKLKKKTDRKRENNNDDE